MTRPPRDIGASAFARLKARARDRGEDFNLTLVRYSCERLLYRLSRSPHALSFMLKGATLFVVWEDEPHRPTRDVDLLGFGEDSAERLRDAFRDVCRQSVVDDGVIFKPDSVTASDIREGQTYRGKRVLVDGRLGTALLRVQVDVGFGDALAAFDTEITMPTLLDFPAPRLRAELPAALTDAFASDQVMLQRWAGFLRRNRLPGGDLSIATHDVRAFLSEPWEALRRGEAFSASWKPGGPWTSSAPVRDQNH